MASYTLLIQYADRPDETRTFEQSVVTIGREGGDIAMNDGQVSGRHGELQFSHGRVVYRDLGSTNGSFREDGQRIFASTELAIGETLRLGQSKITLEEIVGDEAAPPPGNDTLRKPKGTVFAGPGGVLPPRPGPPPTEQAVPPHRGRTAEDAGLPSSGGLPPPSGPPPIGGAGSGAPGLPRSTGLPSPSGSTAAGSGGGLGSSAPGLPGPPKPGFPVASGLPSAGPGLASAAGSGLPTPGPSSPPLPRAVGLPKPGDSGSGVTPGAPKPTESGLGRAKGLPKPSESASALPSSPSAKASTAPPMPTPISGAHRLPPPSSSTSAPRPVLSSNAPVAGGSGVYHAGAARPGHGLADQIKRDIGHAASHYLRHAADGSLTVAVVTIPFAALNVLFTVVPAVGWLFVGLISFMQLLLMPFVTAAVGRWAIATVTGRSMNWQQAWGATVRNLVSDWLNLVVAGLVFAFGLLMLIVPGIIIGLFALPIYLIEDKRFLDIHLRNAELVKDRLGRAFVVLLSGILLSIPVIFAFQVIAWVVSRTPLIGAGLGNLTWAIAGVILTPIMTLLLTKAYLDLRNDTGDVRALGQAGEQADRWLMASAGTSHAQATVASLSSSSGEQPIAVTRAGRSGSFAPGTAPVSPSGPPSAVSGSFPAGAAGDASSRPASASRGGRLPRPGSGR